MKLALRSLGVLASFSLMFLFGFSWRDIQRMEVPSVDAFYALLGLENERAAKLSSVQVFRGSYNRILDRYAGKLDPKELKYAAMEGMVGSLGDPHTVFLPPAATKNFTIETRAKFVGVGARLSPDPLGARIAVIFDGGPADRAGLKVGDWITAVNGKSTEGKDIDEIVSTIRGHEGTYVTLRIMRPQVKDPLTIRVKREKVIAPTVSGMMLEGTEIGYISLDSFSEPTGQQFSRVLKRLRSDGAKALIFDVRDNPGGLLDTARDVLSNFIDDKVVVKMRGRNGREEVVPSFSGQQNLIRLPTVTLIDSESASAAEIFAGVLKDYGLTTLVGEHTYGKAAVQNLFQIKDGASAKITIAKYLLPSGLDVSRKVDEDGQYVSGGLKPDVVVEPDYDSPTIAGDPKSDKQLRAAMDLLKARL